MQETTGMTKGPQFLRTESRANPDTAPETKLHAIARLGGRVIQVPFQRWWPTYEDRADPGVDATFIPAFDDPHVMAGNGVIALGIRERSA